MTDTEELERLAASITQGKWAVDSENQGAAWGMAYCVHAAGNILDEIADDVSSDANARAIALVPDLLAEVIALRAEVERLEALAAYTDRVNAKERCDVPHPTS